MRGSWKGDDMEKVALGSVFFGRFNWCTLFQFPTKKLVSAVSSTYARTPLRVGGFLRIEYVSEGGEGCSGKHAPGTAVQTHVLPQHQRF